MLRAGAGRQHDLEDILAELLQPVLLLGLNFHHFGTGQHRAQLGQRFLARAARAHQNEVASLLAEDTRDADQMLMLQRYVDGVFEQHEGELGVFLHDVADDFFEFFVVVGQGVETVFDLDAFFGEVGEVEFVDVVDGFGEVGAAEGF